VLFSLSWIVIIFGIVRCVTLIKVSTTITFRPFSHTELTPHPQTGEYELSQSGPWSVRESFLAIIVTNAPVVIPLAKRWFVSVTGIASSKAKSSRGDSYQLDSHNQVSKDSKKKKFKHPLSLPTKWGSDEEITTNQSVMGMGGRGKGIDTVSEVDETVGLEIDHLQPQARSKVRVSKTVEEDVQAEFPGEITVTRGWEVASKTRQ